MRTESQKQTVKFSFLSNGESAHVSSSLGLASGSKWMVDSEDGSRFIAGVEGHRIDISNCEPKCIVMTVDEDEAAVGDIRDILAIIDDAGLDPVRVAARELWYSIADDDDGQDFSVATRELFLKLGELL
jgi:hypothetical protein